MVVTNELQAEFIYEHVEVAKAVEPTKHDQLHEEAVAIVASRLV